MPLVLNDASSVAVLGYVIWLLVAAVVKLAKNRNHKGNPGNPNSGKTDTKLNTILSGQKALQESNGRIEVALGIIATLLKKR